MKKWLFFLLILFISPFTLFAQTEIGPEGHKLLWFLVVLVPLAAWGIWSMLKKGDKKQSKPLFKRTRVDVLLEKNKVLFPTTLTLKVVNKGNTDIDLDRPMLIFSNFWMQRKFRLKGVNNQQIYPLYLDAGRTHTLSIDLSGFYGHDKKLKKYPKAKVVVFAVNGKKLGSKEVYLRKTLFR